MTTIYKIVPAAMWRAAEAKGTFDGAPVDLADGYIHFSTADQLAETAAKHFAGQDDLHLVAVDANWFGPELRFEPSRGGDLFPHLYAPLPLVAVRWVKALPLAADGHHAIPDLVHDDNRWRRLLMRIDPEGAHALAIGPAGRVLAGFAPKVAPLRPDPRLARRLLGLDFAHPVGIAAGVDKNARAPAALLAIGAAFIEIGTVTPRPQAGNPAPRVFRLPGDRAVINRLGFNNEGSVAVAARLAARPPGIIGVNLGANRDSPDRAADYVAGVKAFSSLADYLVINVSSPNTPGLRGLQARRELEALLRAVMAARDAARRRVPLLVKIAPDLDRAALAGIAEAVIGSGVDGAIVSNSTIGRVNLTDRTHAEEAGGLSGRPLFRLATIQLARFRQMVGRNFVLIGAGGVDSGHTAWTKIAAGADLVQLYTGLIYRGPGLFRSMLRDLAGRLDREGLTSIGEVVGRDAAGWAALEA